MDLFPPPGALHPDSFPSLLGRPPSPTRILGSSSGSTPPPPSSLNWKEMLHKQMNNGAVAFDLSFIPEESLEVHFSAEDLDEGMKDWEFALVGHALGKRPFYGSLLAAVRKQWKMVEQLCQKYHIPIPQLSPRIPTYRLHFKNKLPDILFTDRKIKAENHMELEIAIVDASNNVIKCGHLASAEIKIVVLDGDFDEDENDEWTKEFEKHVIDARKDKRPLLKGNLDIKLCEGVGYISDVMFTDNSSWRKSKMFRLGLKIDGQTDIVGEVQQGISNAFRVKDRHVEIIQKGRPPLMSDEVCCLKGIFKNGAFHKKLVELNIKTVQDYLCYCSNNNPEMLRTMIGMSKGAWKKTMGHARESKWESYNLLNGLVSLPAPDQDTFEITGQNSSQTLNAPDEHNGVQHSTCYIECEPLILGMSADAQSLPVPNMRFPPRNSFQTIYITRDGAWKGTERLDISWEVLMEGSGISMSNKFNNGIPSSPSKWGMLVFVVRWKALRSKINKYFATSSADNNEPIWEDLPPIENLTP